ncbi:RagB/SusD family nutrient uptake outer membrane protein [Chitinophaga parva]|uniref:RagB/SusD family nutrient uptake outer membrane protein n=1 Tax=Chitinophaga parva TaxID=2169414 RepID=A0A2T7BJE5_9BACT|nr:RagB/SusD family nutrient uptake outer membrane protein [Chitinophaga parva]PUZ26398.1 RagB/SusD family nutrient uptake outer membrane protein [Chitinophaga parva]
MNIKNYFLSAFAGLFFLLALGSCKKFLNDIPNDSLPADSIFANLANVNDYLAQVYANIPDPYVNNRTGNAGRCGYFNYICDDANYFSHPEFTSTNFMFSTLSPSFTTFEYLWPEFYKPVRTATDFINKIDGANPAQVSDYLKAHYKGEARGMRAIFYFWLLRLYGPVVILPDVIPADATDAELFKERTPFDSCVNYISRQLDTAYMEITSSKTATQLPERPLNNEYGRITTGICKAYKEQVLMLAASPLFNGNPSLATLKNQDGTPLTNQAYDQQKWKLAADAAKGFIDEFVPSTYSLYTVTDTNAFNAAYKACRDVVTTDWNSEWIFGKSMCTTVGSYVNQASPKLVGYLNVTVGLGFYSVNQSMVDAYFMKNGLPITDATSGYQQTGFTDFKNPYDVKARSTFNQWVNREPRFYVGVTYNKGLWLDQGSSATEVISDFSYNGSSGRVQSSTDFSATGYLVRKNITQSRSNRGWCYLRLAQIYLDYAEALNEYDPGNADILKYVNLVRARAGVPGYGTESGQVAPPTSQEGVRELIQHERQVELAFEEVRYFDLRRWKLASTYLNQPVYGMNAYGSGNDFYQRTLVQNIRFQQRDYLWPIPSSEVRKDAKLVQNPGW